MRISDWSSDVCSSDLLRDEGLADIAEGGIAREIKAVGGGMDAEGGDRLGRLARMAGEERTHRRPRVGLAPILLVEQMAGIEIVPAVPAARRKYVHQIAGAGHRWAAAFVKAIVGHVETAVGRESQPEGVAETTTNRTQSGRDREVR